MHTKYESFSHCSYVYFICATCNFTVPLYSCCFYLPVVQLYNCLILLHCLMRKCVYAYYRTQSTAEGSVFGAVSLWFFVCVWNISGAAERICAKFTRKTCLVPRSNFKVKVKGPLRGTKKRGFNSHHPRQRRNGTRSTQMTSRSGRRDHSVAAGVISAAFTEVSSLKTDGEMK